MVITKSASWPARLLDGLGGWLVGPDPDLNRLRTVMGATVTIAGAIGAEWLSSTSPGRCGGRYGYE